MTGLDCNILVQLALQDHPANAATVTAVRAEVNRGNRLVFPSLVIDEFLHVITDTRRFNPPLTMTDDHRQQHLAALLSCAHRPRGNSAETLRQRSHHTKDFGGASPSRRAAVSS